MLQMGPVVMPRLRFLDTLQISSVVYTVYFYLIINRANTEYGVMSVWLVIRHAEVLPIHPNSSQRTDAVSAHSLENDPHLFV